MRLNSYFVRISLAISVQIASICFPVIAENTPSHAVDEVLYDL